MPVGRRLELSELHPVDFPPAPGQQAFRDKQGDA